MSEMSSERRHFSRNPKWGPSDFGCKKPGDGHGLRRPTFVLRPSRRALRAAPGLPQGLDAVSHGLAFHLRRRSHAALRRNARPYSYAGVVALRSSLTLPRFPVLLLGLWIPGSNRVITLPIFQGSLYRYPPNRAGTQPPGLPNDNHFWNKLLVGKSEAFFAANERKSVEIGPLSATLPGSLEPAFLGRLFPDKTFGNKALIFIKPHVVGEILDSLYNLNICGHLRLKFP